MGSTGVSGWIVNQIDGYDPKLAKATSLEQDYQAIRSTQDFGVRSSTIYRPVFKLLRGPLPPLLSTPARVSQDALPFSCPFQRARDPQPRSLFLAPKLPGVLATITSVQKSLS